MLSRVIILLEAIERQSPQYALSAHLVDFQKMMDQHLAVPPPNGIEVTVDSVFFTHSSISTTFGHGPHRGQPIELLYADLCGTRIEPSEIPPLDIVSFHGKLRSLRNRRLCCLKRYQRLRPDLLWVRGRIWPWLAVRLTTGVDGNRPVFAKFWTANTTTTDGESIVIRV